MSTYMYAGHLTDFGEAPFPQAKPKMWVEASEPAFGQLGPLAPRRIPVTIAADGRFTVQLIASVDTSPTIEYKLHLNWVHANDTLAGWAEWPFTAAIGGGYLTPTSSVPLSVWWVGPPWPESLPPGFYYDTITDDVGRKG